MCFISNLEYNYLINYYNHFGDGKATSESEEKKNKWALRIMEKDYSTYMNSYYAKRLFPSVFLVVLSCTSKIVVVINVIVLHLNLSTLTNMEI